MEQSVAKEVFEVRLPEEIKRALEHCRTGVPCAGCPYLGDEIANCWDNLTHDLIVCIQQLEAQQPRWISVGERMPEDAERVYVALRCANMIEKLPAVDAVPRDEYDSLLKRFQHLLESDFIRSFDEVKPLTGTYKRDIAEADNVQPNFGAKIDGGDA